MGMGHHKKQTFKKIRIGLLTVAVFIAVGFPIQLLSSKQLEALTPDQIQSQIQALNEDLIRYEKEANKLRSRSNTLKNELSILATEKAAIQAKIDISEAKHKKLVAEIKESEEKIELTREALGDTIADIWIGDQISPLEMVFSSSNIGQFLDKQEYRSSIRDELKTSIGEIKQLKAELEQKRDAVKVVLDEQRAARAELASKEAATQNLLNQTRGQEQNYQKILQETNQRMKNLQKEYERARQSWTGGYITQGGSGGYPWANVGYPCWSPGCSDPWGLFYRECVSFVAWRLDRAGKGVMHFSGAGHAYQWPSTTRNYTTQYGPNKVNPDNGSARGSYVATPHVGDAVVIPPGVQNIPWTGHVMYVESINSDGSINISEYNFAGPGIYSERTISKSLYASYTFITFPNR